MVFDKRENAYFEFKLQEWIRNNPNKDFYGEVVKRVIAKRDLVAIEKDAIFLKSLGLYMPNSILNIMTEIMTNVKASGGTKYAMYRASEDYLYKTDWFVALDNRVKMLIRFDFNRHIIHEVHDFFCRQKYNLR